MKKSKKYKYKRKYIFFKDDFFTYRRVIVQRYKYNSKKKKYFFSKKFEYKQINEKGKWKKIDERIKIEDKNGNATFVLAEIKTASGKKINYTTTIPLKIKNENTIKSIVKNNFSSGYGEKISQIDIKLKSFFDSNKIIKRNKTYKEIKKLMQEFNFLKKMKNKIGDDIYKKESERYKKKIEQLKKDLQKL